MNVLYLLLAAGLVLTGCSVAAGVAAIILFVVIRKKKDDRAKPVTLEVTVLSKGISTQRHPVAGDATGAHGYTTLTVYHAVFLKSDGVQLPLEIDREAYETLVEGERGRLTVRGSRYIGFASR